MLELRPCEPGHIKFIHPQDNAREDYHVMCTPEYAGIITDNFSISAWDGTKCIAAAGIVPIYQGRAAAWALISKEAGPHMVQLTRAIRRGLALDPTPRIETVVNADFINGHRWARMVGMECECPLMRKHGVHGQDEALYVRIR